MLRRIQRNMNYKPCAQRVKMEKAKKCEQKSKNKFIIRVQTAQIYAHLICNFLTLQCYESCIHSEETILAVFNFLFFFLEIYGMILSVDVRQFPVSHLTMRMNNQCIHNHTIPTQPSGFFTFTTMSNKLHEIVNTATIKESLC